MLRARLNHRREEAGIGLLGTTIGTLMMMGLLLMALHTMLALQTRSIVSASAWDAARALSVDATLGSADAESRVNATINGLSPTVKVQRSAGAVSVTVTARSPGIFPGVTSLDDLREVSRTATIRIEEQQ
jgi:Flp pilus assembly protein TadG